MKYSSLEQRIIKYTKELVYDSIRTTYGVSISFFKAPTIWRKLNNAQTIIQENNDKPVTNYLGVGIGTGTGILVGISAIIYCIQSSGQESDIFQVTSEFLPRLKSMGYFSIPFITNMISGIYELNKQNE